MSVIHNVNCFKLCSGFTSPLHSTYRPTYFETVMMIIQDKYRLRHYSIVVYFFCINILISCLVFRCKSVIPLYNVASFLDQ